MRNLNRTVRQLLIACLAGLFVAQPAYSDPGPTPTTDDVLRQISKFRNDPPTPVSEIDGYDLVVMVRRQDFMLVKDVEVDALIGLLGSDEDYIREWAAAAIGYLGPTGRKAEPALRTALARIDCVNADLTSASTIRATFTRIGRVAPPRVCPP